MRKTECFTVLLVEAYTERERERERERGKIKFGCGMCGEDFFSL